MIIYLTFLDGLAATAKPPQYPPPVASKLLATVCKLLATSYVTLTLINLKYPPIGAIEPTGSQKRAPDDHTNQGTLTMDDDGAG